ncbi:MAG: hypothetical protein M0P38_00670 [Bacteroidales bacterium]|nr:hypothetical protein [Bacteroidales bacterium]
MNRKSTTIFSSEHDLFSFFGRAGFPTHQPPTPSGCPLLLHAASSPSQNST